VRIDSPNGPDKDRGQLMEKAIRLRLLGSLTVAAALALAAGPAMAAASTGQGQSAYTCAGGEIPSGSYASITVTGVCSVPAGAVISVVGNIDVTAGAMFDAQSAPSTITVGRNVTGATGSLVGLGCQPPSYTGNSAHECAIEPEGHSTITVNGNVSVTDAALVALNGITVKGNITLAGGGDPNPWGIPSYWSVKNNEVGRNITVSGQTVEWIGVMFNRVGGNVTLTDITVNDEHPGAPGVYVVRNAIGRNLNCTGLTPGVSGGFVPGSVNVVGRNATGQCASLV
jgi:hypothetical protein